MIERIGRFEIQERGGETPVGRVYRALDPSLGLPVVIKTIRLPERLSDEAREGILREARLVGSLSHPNIATVLDAGIEEDFAYVAAEQPEGQLLAALVSEAAPFRPSAILPWLDQIADALDYAHRRGVLHRDLTPSAILLTRVGQIKIADFGVAKMAMTADTDRSVPLGTPSYMSPEQVRGDAVDHRSDIYALGVVIFELLTGKRPFEGGTLVSTVFKVVNQDVPRASETVASLDPQFDEVLGRALAKPAGDRFASAREFVDALREVARTASLPVPQAAEGSADAPGRFCDQCGTALKPNVKFCYRCGAEVVPPEAIELTAREFGEPETQVMASPVPSVPAQPVEMLRTNPSAPVRAEQPALAQETTVRLGHASPTGERSYHTQPSARITGTVPLAGYAASTGSLELPPPGVDLDTPPSRLSSLSGLLIPVVVFLGVVALAGVGGYMLAPRLLGGYRVPVSEVTKSEPALPVEQPVPAETAQPEQPSGPFPVTVLAPQTKETADPQLATGPPDGRFARIAPNGELTIAFPQGQVLKDDGTEKPDLKVAGAGEDVSFIVAVRRADGNYQIIDRVQKFDSADMNHHKVPQTDAVRIKNTGKTELLIDAVEGLRPLTAP